MPSSNQQPEDESKLSAAGEPVEPEEVVEPEAFQPLYEFPPDALDARPEAALLTQVLPEKAAQPPLSPEAIQQGLVYPPPPSYYQNLPLQTERPSLPQPPRGGPSLPNGLAYAPSQSPPLHQPSQQGGTRYPPPGLPAYPAGMPVYGQPYKQQPPVKKSRRWLWILLSVLGVIILASCGLCGWGAYTFVSSTYQQVSGALNVVDDFYSNLQAENYSAAYSDLAPQGQIIGLTQSQFTAQASKLDQQYGPVASFSLGQPSFSNDAGTGPNLSRFTIAVDIKRTHLSYTALLTVNKIGGTWKITQYDGI
jgi:hypothetical protein